MDLKYAEEALEKGALRLSLASTYQTMKNDCARCDDELNKNLKLLNTKVFNTSQQKSFGKIDNAKINSSSRDYYVLCTSTKFYPYLFSDFKADACLNIFNVESFLSRLYIEADRSFPGAVSLGQKITYGGLSKFGATFEKNNQYLFQHEWRFVIRPTEEATQKHIYISIGNMEDIANIIKN